MSFFSVLEKRVKKVDSILCVGLDPHAADLENLKVSLPQQDQDIDDADLAFQFCNNLVQLTHHVAAAYKPNAAFFEALGPKGITNLYKLIKSIPDGIPVVLDAKRGDISSTAAAYATAAFECAKADCITLHPYMGYDSIEPFVVPDVSKGCFVLCKTSNPSSNDFETLSLQSGELLYENVARKCEEWNKATNNIGLVVGATDVEALSRSRKAAPNLWILAPGVGFQGGNLEAAADAGLMSNGLGLLVPVSRGISRAKDPKSAAEELRAVLNSVRVKKQQKEKEKKGDSQVAIEDHQIEFFRLALQCGVLKFGSFTLKSGRVSPYFFNAGLFSSGSALTSLAKCYAETIVRSGIEFQVLFGPAYKGIPLASIISVALKINHNVDVDVAYNRKEAKDHGEGGELVGAPVKGKTILIVDDVITAGTAIRESMELLAREGAKVVGVSIALDRQEKANEETNQSAIQVVQKEFGIKVCSIAGLEHLLSFLKNSPDFSADANVFSSVSKYREKYGSY
uniref:Orotidine 5'-phosphate decarboxylase n=1 Tax=Aplanochytrium stocchinoi TaxID=215587 RepID=A0A7S3LI26_9STRA